MNTTSGRGKFLAAAAGLFFCGAFSAGAYAAGYEFDGVGSRAVARGGAVIAGVSDWTAIYWNPAGLAGLAGKEAGFDLRAGRLTSKDGNSFKSPITSFSKTHNTPSFVLGSAGGAVPLGGASALGVGFYVPLMQGVAFHDKDVLGAYNNFKSDGYAAIAVVNLSYASVLSEKISGGLGLDVIYAKLKSKTVNDFAVNPFSFTPDVMENKVDGAGHGVEGVFGLKYKHTENVSYGAVFRTGSKFQIKGDASFHSAGSVLPDEKSDFALEFKHPPTSGIGGSWKAGRNLTLTCDHTQTWWKGFSNKTSYDTPGIILKNTDNTYSWSNSYKIRAGALWNYDARTDLLFGYAFDTPAIDARSVDFSTAIDVPMHRFSAAVTRRLGGLEATLGALAGGGSRTAGGVHYAVSGWYVMSEARYKF